MKWLFGSLVILIVAAIIGLLAYEDAGYVLIGRGYKTVEMTLSLFVVLIVVGFILSYFLVRLAITGWNMPATFRAWREQQRRRSARRDTNRGLVELAQGNWALAERYLLRSARNSEIPLLNYLSAARAAQKQNASGRRDDYLSMAHQSMQGAGFAVQLTQAELQLVQGQLEQSLATLMQLHASSPKHPHVMYLLARIYQQLRSWGDLKDLLPALRKYDVLNQAAYQRLERIVHRELLTLETQRGKLDGLRANWQKLPKALRQDVDMVRHYVRCLLILEAPDDAEHLLRDVIKRTWDHDLVYLYGMIEGSDAARQLSTAEGWLKGHEKNPVLLLTLGRLSRRNKLWGKARSYLNTSIGIRPNSDAYRELGELMEQLKESDKAADYFRKGLRLAAEEKSHDLLNITPLDTQVLSVNF